MKKDFKIIDTPAIFSNIPFQCPEENIEIDITDKQSNIQFDNPDVPDNTDKFDETDKDIELKGSNKSIEFEKNEVISNPDKKDSINKVQSKIKTVIETNNAAVYLALKSNNGNLIFLREGIIGTGKKADIVLADHRYISREHAEIIFRDKRVFIEDNNSKNGTYVNNIKISGDAVFELKEGDILKLADVEFLVVTL